MPKHFPIAIALTKTHGWQTIHRREDVVGMRFEGAIYLREPPEELDLALRAAIPGGGSDRFYNFVPPRPEDEKRYFDDDYAGHLFRRLQPPKNPS